MDTRSLVGRMKAAAPAQDVPAPLRWLASKGLQDRTFCWDGLTLVIRGYLRSCPESGPAFRNPSELLDRERLAEELRWRYLEQGTLDLSEMEGSATVVLLDAQTEEVHAARTRGSPFPLFYRIEGDRLVLSHNLAEMARSEHPRLPADPLAARVWIDQGELPEMQTLFAGVFRLLPGERITLDRQGFQREPIPETPPAGLTLEQLDAVMRDCLKQLDRPATVLAGSWPSACLQGLRNRHLAADELLPASVSLAIDEPKAWDNTDWVMRLSQRLGTRNLLLAADRPASALLETLAVTAEPPGSDLELFLAPFTAQLQGGGLRSVLLDCGVSSRGQELTHDPGVIRQAEQVLACLEQAGVEALCPFLDSRLPAGGDLGKILRMLLPPLPPPPCRRPTALLRGWLRPDQPLAEVAAQVRTHGLMTPGELDLARRNPTDRLARLVSYDLWHRLFMEDPS